MNVCFSVLIAVFLIVIPNTNVIASDIPVSPQNKILHLLYSDGYGLGNRIKKTVSYLRYYKPKHINLYWPATGWVNARFSDLFAPEWNMTYTEYNLPSMIKKFPYSQPLGDYVNEYSLLVAADEFKDGKHRFIDLQYNNIPSEIIKLYLPYFGVLKPSAAVKKRINDVKLPQNAVAVQVRNAPDWQKYFQVTEPEKAFYEVMDKFPSDTVFYLSAMSKESAAPFYKRYSNRIMELPSKDYRSMTDAVADMYILGQTKEAIYQYNSTFAEVGWWLGGAKAKVHIVGNAVYPTTYTPPLKILEHFPKN